LLGFLALQLSVGTMDFAELGRLAANKELAAGLAKSFSSTGLDGYALLTVVAVAVFLGLAVKMPSVIVARRYVQLVALVRKIP